MKNILIVPVVLIGLIGYGQVGINTTTPTTDLDVIGDTKVDRSLFLENPGLSNQINDSDFLIQTTNNNIIKYDIDTSRYGPINYVRFVFRDTSTHGLEGYDTKIPVHKYILTVQGFYFMAANANTNVLLRSSIHQNNIEGFQIYAFPNPATHTWFLKAVVNNSTFRSGAGFGQKPIDLFLNVIIYRRGFITKSLPNRYVNMNFQENATATLPNGF